MIFSVKQTDGSMEWNERPKNKFTHLWTYVDFFSFVFFFLTKKHLSFWCLKAILSYLYSYCFGLPIHQCKLTTIILVIKLVEREWIVSFQRFSIGKSGEYLFNPSCYYVTWMNFRDIGNSNICLVKEILSHWILY